MDIAQSLGIILLIVTSHGKMDDGHPTGLWLEEFSIPYSVFTEAGYEVIVASPEGGAAPVDPRSMPDDPSAHDKKALELLKNTQKLSDVLDRKVEGTFFSGGHGTMFDFPEDPSVQKIVQKSLSRDQPIALVCHGPAALVGGATSESGSLLNNRKVTGFTNEEERAVDLVDEMPFLLETRLKELGATFVSVQKFSPNVVVDGNLVTGQNPPSSKGTAEALLKQIESSK